MSPSRIAAGRRAARALIALAAAAACAGAALAYAASRPSGAPQGLGENRAVQQPPGSGPAGGGAPPSRERLLRPRLIEAPAETTAESDPQFRFHVPPRRPPATAPPPGQPQQGAQSSSRRFQCRLDGEGWSECSSPHRLTGLAPGSHRFAVRVFNREERAGEPVDFAWRQTAAATVAPPAPSEPVELEPKPFSIVALQEPENLYPGLPPTPIPVRIDNPNEVAIEVTAVSVAVGAAPAACPAENFELIPAGASPANPVVVPAGGSAELPAAGVEAPAMRMLDLPVEQDACRGAEISLVFSGEARG